MIKLRPKHAYIHPPGATPGVQTNAGWWADIANSPKCREAVGVALLELAVNQQSATLQEAANNAYRLEGARQLIQILLNLGEPDIAPGLPETKRLQPT